MAYVGKNSETCEKLIEYNGCRRIGLQHTATLCLCAQGDLSHNDKANITVPSEAYNTSASQYNSERSFFLFELDEEPPSMVMASPQVTHLGVTNQSEITVFFMASAPVYAFSKEKLICKNCEIVYFHSVPGSSVNNFQNDGSMNSTGTIYDEIGEGAGMAAGGLKNLFLLAPQRHRKLETHGARAMREGHKITWPSSGLRIKILL